MPFKFGVPLELKAKWVGVVLSGAWLLLAALLPALLLVLPPPELVGVEFPPPQPAKADAPKSAVNAIAMVFFIMVYAIPFRNV